SSNRRCCADMACGAIQPGDRVGGRSDYPTHTPSPGWHSDLPAGRNDTRPLSLLADGWFVRPCRPPDLQIVVEFEFQEGRAHYLQHVAGGGIFLSDRGPTKVLQGR